MRFGMLHPFENPIDKTDCSLAPAGDAWSDACDS